MAVLIDMQEASEMSARKGLVRLERVVLMTIGESRISSIFARLSDYEVHNSVSRSFAFCVTLAMRSQLAEIRHDPSVRGRDINDPKENPIKVRRKTELSSVAEGS